MPIAQLVMRSLATKAAKGDHRSQRLMAEPISHVEQDQAQLIGDHHRMVRPHEEECFRDIGRAEKRGLPPPKPVPDPQDIILCPHTASVKYVGPMNEAEQQQLEILTQLFHHYVEEWETYERLAEEAETPKDEAEWSALAENAAARFEAFMEKTNDLGSGLID